MKHMLEINENKQKTEFFCHIQYCVHCDNIFSFVRKRAWHRAKGIRSSTLSSGESPDAQSRELSIALNHREIASILAVTGTINPPYHHLIVDHLIETKLMGIISNQLHQK